MYTREELDKMSREELIEVIEQYQESFESSQESDADIKKLEDHLLGAADFYKGSDVWY